MSNNVVCAECGKVHPNGVYLKGTVGVGAAASSAPQHAVTGSPSKFSKAGDPPWTRPAFTVIGIQLTGTGQITIGDMWRNMVVSTYTATKIADAANVHSPGSLKAIKYHNLSDVWPGGPFQAWREWLWYTRNYNSDPFLSDVYFPPADLIKWVTAIAFALDVNLTSVASRNQLFGSLPG